LNTTPAEHQALLCEDDEQVGNPSSASGPAITASSPPLASHKAAQPSPNQARPDDEGLNSAHRGGGLFSKLKGGRGMLDQRSVWEVLAAQKSINSEAKFIIGSVCDDDRTSFVAKPIQMMGAALDLTPVGLGFACRKGLKPMIPNQDSWVAMKVLGEFSIYAVFDGHGLDGHTISNFVKDHLVKLIIGDRRFRMPDMPEMLKDAFRRLQAHIETRDLQRSLSAKMSGTTATVAVHDHKKQGDDRPRGRQHRCYGEENRRKRLETGRCKAHTGPQTVAGG